MLTWRTAALTAVTAALVAGCSSASAPPADTSGAASTTAAGTATKAAPKSARGDGDESAIDTIPWDDVGPGWTLATWTMDPYIPGNPPATGESSDKTDTTLYLVGPSGDRYPITTFPSHGDGYGPQVVDWSGDGERALINDVDSATTIIVDVQTGEQTTAPFAADDRFAPHFTLPSGEAVLLTHDNGSQPPTLERVDMSGQRELLYPTDNLGSPFSGDFLPTPDGTQLVLGLEAGSVVVMGNDGTVGRTLSVPGVNQCSPDRWWDGETLLAHCNSNGGDQPQLWLMPLDGGAPTALTAPNPGKGDLTAWQVPAGTFVQTAWQCSSYVLEELNTDGTTSQVTVPGTDPNRSIFVIGVSGDDLIVRAAVSCGPGEALIDYDPAANTSTVLLGPSVNGGSVTTAVAYPGQE